MEPITTLHIVGYKNSGKTTLITNWVEDLKHAGLQVAVIKHHGHGAKLAMPDERKDSMKYLTAGADTSIVAGGGYTQHMIQKELDFPALIQLAKAEQPDIILVEGYKEEAGPKVALVRKDEDWETLQHVKHIELVIGLENACPYPQVDKRENRAALQNWLTAWLDEKGKICKRKI